MTRRATIRSRMDGPEVIAASLRPDNTPEIETVHEDGSVITRVERESTSGLRSTLDDYVVNLAVAVEVEQLANRHKPTDT